MIEPEQSRMDPRKVAERETVAPTNAENTAEKQRPEKQRLQNQRLKDALRENLRRRNTQRRGRSGKDLNPQTAD